MKTKNIRPGVVFWLLYIAYTAIYIARLNLSIAAPGLEAAGVLTAAQLGFIGSAFSVIYSCGRLFNGMVGDRLAPKLLIVTGLLLTGCANLLLGFLPPYLLIFTLWSLNAFGQSMLWSSLLQTVTTLYGKAGANKKTPILVSSVSVGNILGILLGNRLAAFDLRAAFLIPGAMTVVCGLLVLYIAPPAPKLAASGGFPFKALLTDKKIRGILLPAMFHGTMKDNIPLWMAMFFTARFAVDLEASPWYVLLIPTVGLAGRLLYPFCYRLSRGRENAISVLCFLVCAALAVSLCLPGITPLVAALCLSLIYALVSMINTSFLSMFPLRFADKGFVSSVSGIADFATYLGAGIASAIYGIFIDGGIAGYTVMFASWAVLSVLSVALLLPGKPFLKEEEV